MKILTINRLCVLLIIISNLGCNKDFLERSPLSSITPDDYLTEESHLTSYALKLYEGLTTHGSSETGGFGTFGLDQHTDNMASLNYSNKYIPGEFRVSQSGGQWEFTGIYPCNYFLSVVLPRWHAGELLGTSANIEQAIGEIYFFRAWEYFKKLQRFGDFPIIKEVLPDDGNVLSRASQRAPRSEVARFILSDLDSAISLLNERSPDGAKNRLNKGAAQLFKSRVALYEGTWLKYFNHTAFVPNGPNWPGKQKSYQTGYNFQAGSIEGEIDWLMTQAMTSARAVADQFTLVPNNGILKQQLTDPDNAYFSMFSDVDMSKYSEVLLWRRYDAFGLNVRHTASSYAAQNNFRIGLTRGYVDNFLMANGLPIYDPASGYLGDDYLSDVRKQRDGRLFLFLKEPGQKNVLEMNSAVYIPAVEVIPNLTSTSEALAYFTGYTIRKGVNYNTIQLYDVGSIVFRSAEALLNYMEACYEKNGSLDDLARDYWKKLRVRAGVDPDIEKTIAATDLNKEAQNDWAVYSGGNKVSTTLYNIRRERRSELLAEGFREMDLKRWRALDQMITTPYQIEGFKVWGPMKEWYRDTKGGLILTYGTPNANVSSPQLSHYLRPYQRTGKELVYTGYKWAMAHYLDPIALQHFIVTSSDQSVNNSPLYQNPGWPLEANLPAIGY